MVLGIGFSSYFLQSSITLDVACNKVTISLCAGPLCDYPQRIKRTNVRYVRGK